MLHTHAQPAPGHSVSSCMSSQQGLAAPNIHGGEMRAAGASGAGKTTFMVRSHALPVQAGPSGSVSRTVRDGVDVLVVSN